MLSYSDSPHPLYLSLGRGAEQGLKRKGEEAWCAKSGEYMGSIWEAASMPLYILCEPRAVL